jgi:hypothetical protein
MPFDPNIALQVRGIELPNKLAQYAQFQQIQANQQAQELNQLKMQEARLASESRNNMRGLDYNSPNYVSEVARFDPELASKIAKDQAAMASSQAQANVYKADAATKRNAFMAQADRDLSNRPSDANITAYLEDTLASDLFTPVEKAKVQKRAESLLAEPFEKRAAMLAMTGSSASDVTSRANNAATVAASLANNAATVGATLRGQNLTDARARENLKVSQDRLAFDQQKAEQPQFNAQAGGFIAPPTKQNPQGLFIPATGIQAAKDQGAAVKALQSAGYNAETGEDTISKLIAKSTSGGLQAGGAATLAFFGKSTEGRKAIAALEGTANQIATDLAGGKLGAGISNTDREFIVSALGDVANPNKTSEERLAGWNAAKNRMMLTGLIPPPKAPTANTPTVAPNIDALLNKYK